jgi:hypothetical protein
MIQQYRKIISCAFDPHALKIERTQRLECSMEGQRITVFDTTLRDGEQRRAAA